MKKTGVIILIGLMMLIALYPSVSANDSGIVVDQELVTISLANKGLQVDETIKVTNTGTENVTIASFLDPTKYSGYSENRRVSNQAKSSFLLSQEISGPVT